MTSDGTYAISISDYRDGWLTLSLLIPSVSRSQWVPVILINSLPKTRWNRGLGAFAKVTGYINYNKLYTSWLWTVVKLFPAVANLFPSCQLPPSCSQHQCHQHVWHCVTELHHSTDWVTELHHWSLNNRDKKVTENEQMNTKTHVRQLVNLALLQIRQLHLWGDKWLWRGIPSYQLSVSYWLDTAIRQLSRYNMKSQERDVSSLLYSDVPILPARYKFSRI